MPIYEYRCQSCHHELEKLQRLNDPVLMVCPHCGKAKLRRLISAAGFRLKGAGWYETDFKQGNKRNLAESSGGKSDGSAAAEAAGGKSDGAAKSDSAGGKSDGPAKVASPAGTSDGSANAGKSKTTGNSASDTA
jgi:putative FmdB family regulatory protein